ncbi:MAG TPA: DUF3261 domain-containing protein [Nitrospirota bacterium]
MKRTLIAFLLVFGAVACVRVPFQETELVPLGSEDPRGIVERFQASIPESFQLLSTVVFEYNWRAFPPVLGYVDISTKDHSFNVVGINPMGVKLFELSGDRSSVTTRYAIAAFTRYGDIGAAVGNDIRRIYFDLVPSPNAAVGKHRYRIVFRQPFDQGTLEYVYAGQGDLVEKNYYEDQALVWRVRYYEYTGQNGKRWPRGILFLNYRYGYRLTIRHKEFHA